MNNPFFYDNSSNLIIACDENTPTSYGPNDDFFQSNTIENRGIYKISNYTNPSPANPSSGVIWNYRANIKLIFSVIPPPPPSDTGYWKVINFQGNRYIANNDSFMGINISPNVVVRFPQDTNHWTQINPFGVSVFGINGITTLFGDRIGLQGGDGTTTIEPGIVSTDTLYAEEITSKSGQQLQFSGDTKINGELTTKKVTVTLDGFPDYVFSTSYKRKTLGELDEYIQKYNHLPDMPTEKEVKENGIDIGSMQAKLLEKIEEISLYLIELKKENKALKDKIEQIEKK